MNQIQEKDWADTSWHGHTGMDSTSDYCIVDDTIGTPPTATSGAAAPGKGTDTDEKQPERDQG